MGQKASKSVAEEVDKSKKQIEIDYNIFKRAEGFQCNNYNKQDTSAIDTYMKATINIFILIFILFCMIIYIYLLFRSRKK